MSVPGPVLGDGPNGSGVLEMLPGGSSPVGSSGRQAVGSTGRLSWRWPVCRSAGGKDTSPHWGITEPSLRAWRLVSAHVSRERETGPFGWSLARICRLDAQGAGYGLPGGQWKAGSEAGLTFAEHPPQPWSRLGPVVPPTPLPPAAPQSQSRLPGIRLRGTDCLCQPRGAGGGWWWGGGWAAPEGLGACLGLRSRGQRWAGLTAPRRQECRPISRNSPRTVREPSLCLPRSVFLSALGCKARSRCALVLESEAPGAAPTPPPPPTRVRLCGAPEWARPAPSAPTPVLMSPLWEWPFVAGSGHTACARGSQKARFTSPGAPGVDNGSSRPALSPFPLCFLYFGGMRTHTPLLYGTENQTTGFSPSLQLPALVGGRPGSQPLLWDLPPPLSPSSCFWVSPGSFPLQTGSCFLVQNNKQDLPPSDPCPAPIFHCSLLPGASRPSPPSHPPLLGPWQPWAPGQAAPAWPIGFSSS